MDVNPEDYPHTLEWQGRNVFLISQTEMGQERRNLGSSSGIQDAYRRWKHMLDAHGREPANIFLWGVLTGMSVALWTEIDAIVKNIKSPSDR
jgi:hypothetical protein